MSEGSPLIAAFGDLRRALAPNAGGYRFAEPTFSRMRRVEQSLSKPRRLRYPAGIDVHVAEWHRFCEGSGPEPGGRAVSALCWHPKVACSDPFQRFIEGRRQILGGRALEGLIRSCHRNWRGSIGSGALAAAHQHLERFSGRRRQIVLWKRNRALVAAEGGPGRLGDFMAARSRAPEQVASDLGIDKNSEFFHLAVRAACAECRRFAAAAEHRKFLLSELLPWKGWGLDEFKEEFQAAVRAAGDAGVAHEALVELARRDARLLDPRLPRNQGNWAGIPDARRAVIAWLSRFDIVFFFDHVLTNRNDPHGRKEFWLQYAPMLQASRPVLCAEDASRLRAALGVKMPEAAVMGGDSATSAFILHFGRLIAVEFSAVGNALYLYTGQDASRAIPDLWVARFWLHQLKRATLARKRIVHTRGWKEVASTALAQYGIRP